MKKNKNMKSLLKLSVLAAAIIIPILAAVFYCGVLWLDWIVWKLFVVDANNWALAAMLFVANLFTSSDKLKGLPFVVMLFSTIFIWLFR